MNKGNSGGPIVKVGKSPDEDLVIGIADFIISSGGDNLNPLNTLLQKMQEIALPNIDTNDKACLNLKFALGALNEASMNTANGVSGCVAIDHFEEYFKK